MLKVVFTCADESLSTVLARAMPEWSSGMISVALLSDPNQILRELKDVDCIVHVGARADNLSESDAIKLNVASTENVMSAAKAAGLRLSMFISSTDVSLGRTDRVHWNETKSLSGKPFGFSAQSLLLSEELIQACTGSPWIIFRPAYVWGLSAESLSWSNDEKSHGPYLFGSGNHLMSGTHLKTLVAALRWVFEHFEAAQRVITPQKVRTFNIVDAQHTTAKELFTQITSALQIPSPRRGLPGALASILPPQGVSKAEVIRRTFPTLFDPGAFEHFKSITA